MKKLYILMLLIFTMLSSSIYAQPIELLPAKNLYDAPIADPRWPKFLMGVSHDFKGSLGKRLWTFNFGEDIGLLQFGSKQSPYEIGIQAGVFGLMDIASKPSILVNTDYMVALGLSHVHNQIQYLLQLSHISSHVGDELLLSQAGQDLQRINLSYETLKCFVRYKSTSRFSPYIVLGYIVTVDPNTIKRAIFAGGVDYFSHRIIFKDSTRLIAGAFVNAWQENNYSPTVTIRMGMQYERTKYCNRFLQLFLEYQCGKSQQGQFYNTNIQQVGIVVAYSS